MKVNGKDDPIYEMEKNNVWNHQPKYVSTKKMEKLIISLQKNKLNFDPDIDPGAWFLDIW